MMRIVADSNILVSSAIKPNSRFANHIRQGLFLLLLSDVLLKELANVLGRPHLRIKYNLTPEYIYWYFQLLHSRSEQVEHDEVITICRDKDDNKFLEVAVSGKADLIITNDSDLLILHPFRNIPIVSLTDFWNIFANYQNLQVK